MRCNRAALHLLRRYCPHTDGVISISDHRQDRTSPDRAAVRQANRVAFAAGLSDRLSDAMTDAIPAHTTALWCWAFDILEGAQGEVRTGVHANGPGSLPHVSPAHNQVYAPCAPQPSGCLCHVCPDRAGTTSSVSTSLIAASVP